MPARTPHPAPVNSTELQRAYGVLRTRLNANWHVLRDCRLAAQGEEYAFRLVLINADFGIGLISLAPESYAFPDLAIRIARAVLRESGFDEHFAGFVPVVFLAIDPRDLAAVPARISQAFAEAAPLSVSDSGWAEWAVAVLRRNSAEAGCGGWDGGTVEEGPAAAPWRNAATPHRGRHRVAGRFVGMAAVIGACAVGVVGGGLAWRYGTEVSLAASDRAALPPACEVRLFSKERLARYLGLDPEGLERRLDELAKAGFPAAEPITGRYDRGAVDRWLDARTRATGS